MVKRKTTKTMSKEKLSAEEWLNLNYDPEYVHYENDGVKRIKDIPHSELCNRMEAYAQYKTEQLQREKEELLKFAQSVAMFESWAIHSDERGPINFRANMIVKKYESDLTPKPEKL